MRTCVFFLGAFHDGSSGSATLLCWDLGFKRKTTLNQMALTGCGPSGLHLVSSFVASLFEGMCTSSTVYWYCVLILCTTTVYYYCVLILCTHTVY